MDQDDPYASTVLGGPSWRNRRDTKNTNDTGLFGEENSQATPAATGPRPDLTALLYAGQANTGLTSGKGLFGADAIGGDGGFGAKSGGGMFDDDEDEIFGTKKETKAPAQVSQPAGSKKESLFGAESDDDDFMVKKGNAAPAKKKLGGFLDDDDEDDDTFVPGQKPNAGKPAAKKNAFAASDDEDEGFKP